MASIYNPPIASTINGGYNGYNTPMGVGPNNGMTPNYIDNGAQKNLMTQMYLNQMNREAREANPANRPMDTVYQPPLSDTFQGRMLDVKSRELGQKDVLAAGNLGVKQGQLDLNRQKASTDAQVKQQRADVYKWKAEHPNDQLHDVNGRVMAIDPQTHQMVDLGDSSQMDEKDKTELQIQGRISAINAQNTARRGQINLQGDIGSRQIGERGTEQRTTDAAKADNPKSVLPTQIKVQQYLRAHELISKNPALSQYITMGPNDFTITPSWGSDPAVLKQINDYIYGKDTVPARTGTKTTDNAVSKVSDATPPRGAKAGGTWVDTKFGRVYKEP